MPGLEEAGSLVAGFGVGQLVSGALEWEVGSPVAASGVGQLVLGALEWEAGSQVQ